MSIDRQSVSRRFDAGCRLLKAGQPRKAAREFTAAAELDPDSTEILEKLGQAQLGCGENAAALKVYRSLVALGADTGETWKILGEIHSRSGDHALAIDAFERALKLGGASAELHHHFGKSLFHLGEIDRAAEQLELAAKDGDRLGPVVSLANIIPGAPSADAKKIMRVRQDSARLLATETPAPREAREAVAVDRKANDGRLRIGYLSAHFHSENYMKPVWALINRHNRSRFEIHLFSDSPKGQGMPGYLAETGDRVHHVAGLDNDTLTQLISRNGIDVLIDLSGYSFPERLGLFLTHPAPVTVAWFNSFATSGLPGIDWIVGDDEVVSRRDEKHFTEKVARLPLSYLTFEVTHEAPPVAPPPCLRNGYITFGSLISQYKITPPVIEAWAKILRKTESRLVLANTALQSPSNRSWMLKHFVRHGIDPERISLFGPAPHIQFLRHYDRIDIALDGFPYNGGTTTMEAIWQGVPVLTPEGDRWAARTSQTILRRCHLGEFVAGSVRSMVKQAIKLARDPHTPERLRVLRDEMRSRLEASSACDGTSLARAMETFFQEASRNRT
ncbi:MAG: tetratricopeptide repeat protein [Verrucomicrobiales bacterium]